MTVLGHGSPVTPLYRWGSKGAETLRITPKLKLLQEAEPTLTSATVTPVHVCWTDWSSSPMSPQSPRGTQLPMQLRVPPLGKWSRQTPALPPNSPSCLFNPTQNSSASFMLPGVGDLLMLGELTSQHLVSPWGNVLVPLLGSDSPWRVFYSLLFWVLCKAQIILKVVSINIMGS